MSQYILKSPMYLKGVYGGKNANKNFAINRNSIHQTNHFIIAKAKRCYKAQMEQQILALPQLTKINVLFVLHRPDRRRADRGNVSYETCKFFMDALTHFDRLPDDSDEYYIHANFRTGAVCKGDPHVEIIITDMANEPTTEELVQWFHAFSEYDTSDICDAVMRAPEDILRQFLLTMQAAQRGDF